MPPKKRATGVNDIRPLRARLVALVEEFHWLHLTLGLIGNVSFFVGSVLFLFEPLKTAGIWLFIVGSFGMLLGTIGDAVVSHRGDDVAA